MFAPNSIKTLMSIKNYNQLDQSKDGVMRPFTPKDGDKDNRQEMDHSSIQHRDMTDKVISTRVLLKGFFFLLKRSFLLNFSPNRNWL